MLQTTHTETSRIADQLRRSFAGEAWHGPALLEILDGVTAAEAAARPLPTAHRIWDIVRHVAVWDDAARRRMAGEVVQPPPHEDWPAVTDESPEAWQRTVADLKRTHDALVAAVTACPDARLSEKVPGKEPDYYTLYYMLHGLVQHALYHARQGVILQKAVGR